MTSMLIGEINKSFTLKIMRILEYLVETKGRQYFYQIQRLQ